MKPKSVANAISELEASASLHSMFNELAPCTRRVDLEFHTS
jgi:hypothetical protein